MKHPLFLFTILIVSLSNLTAVPARAAGNLPLPLEEPLTITLTGGACLNCLRAFTDNPCDQSCTMPLRASITNATIAPMVVEVMLTIDFPNGTDCENAADKQMVQYFIPAGANVELNYDHSFAGFAVATFNAFATVVESEDPMLVGYMTQNELEVASVWPMCGGPGGSKPKPKIISLR